MSGAAGSLRILFARLTSNTSNRPSLVGPTLHSSIFVQTFEGYSRSRETYRPQFNTMSSERSAKRRRVDPYDDSSAAADISASETESEIDEKPQASQAMPIRSLNRDITPPLASNRDNRPGAELVPPLAPLVCQEDDILPRNVKETMQPPSNGSHSSSFVPSPISLTRIRDLPQDCNLDTVTLRDILGDPLIKEAWIFNYLHNIPFIMSALDPDVRDIVAVKIIHGSWKQEDAQGAAIKADAARYANVDEIRAYMPEVIGTHHSKAIILIRHDDMAQVVIHTANMVPQDWTNLTQAVWRSPLLPRTPHLSQPPNDPPIGSGHRFKADLLRYLRFYGKRTRALTDQLVHYDFSHIRAALVASCPGRHSINADNTATQSIQGWRALKEVLKKTRCPVPIGSSDRPQIVIQISSIATLGQQNTWFTPFLKTLATTRENHALFGLAATAASNPRVHVVFPTSEEIRHSFDGYVSGASIHMKLQSAQQQKQLEYLQPMLRHWDPSGELYAIRNTVPGTRGSLRRRAAPHIKTYIRFSSAKMDRIDWAMLTSANLSKQAWGEMEKDGKNGEGKEVRISNYELGVVVWPALFDDMGDGQNAGPETVAVCGAQTSKQAVMVPVFAKNTPDAADMIVTRAEGEAGQSHGVTVGFRMPYDLPLVSYSQSDVPWCATAEHNEPDWKGLIWAGYVPNDRLKKWENVIEG